MKCVVMLRPLARGEQIAKTVETVVGGVAVAGVSSEVGDTKEIDVAAMAGAAVVGAAVGGAVRGPEVIGPGMAVEGTIFLPRIWDGVEA
jgi:hypothetical protein